MGRSDDDAPGIPRPRTLVLRGFARHCPLCGSGHLFRRWFTLVERCPRCGHRFERRNEDGFFLGAYLINLSFGLVLLGGALMGYGLSLAGLVPGGGAPWLVAAGVVSLVVPVAAYPSTKTTWSAIHLILHPPDPDEQTEALEAIAHRL